MSTPPSSYGYGERPPLQGFRRSFTAPHRKLSYHERAALDPSDAEANLWYRHPSARIVHFSPPTDSISNSTSSIPPNTDYPVDTVETLPWSSTGESTLAMGELKIEKVQGSTNFIKCGNVNQALLMNSQSWCVDGVSRFVLRVRKLHYYRIELPDSTAEDKARVEELKEVLKKIIKFEATPCPFRRGFHIELPASAITPRRRGTWKKKEAGFATPTSEGSQLPRLRSSRTWSRRAVSESKASSQPDVAQRNNPDYAESPLANRSQLPSRIGSSLRPDTPSSTASSEDLSKSMEIDQNSEAVTSDQEETLPEDLGSPDRIFEVPLRHGEALNESIDNGNVHSMPCSEVSDQKDVTVVPPSQEPEEDSGDHVLPTHWGKDADDQFYKERHSPVSPPAEFDAEASQAEALSEDVASKTLSIQADKENLDIVEDAGEGKVDLPDYRDLTAGASSERAVANDNSNLPAGNAEGLRERVPTVEGEEEDALTTISTTNSDDVLAKSANAVFDDNVLVPNDERPATPPLTASSLSESSWADMPTPLSPYIDQSLRQRLKARRSLSPVPTPSTVFIPAQHQSQGHHLTASILQKAAAVALVKPIEVVVLIFHILAKIVSGATVDDLLSGELFRRPDQPHNRTTSATLPDQIQHDQRDSGSQEDDDLGVLVRNGFADPMSANTPTKSKKVPETDSLFEID